MPKLLRNYYFENNKVVICDHKGLFDDMPSALCDYGKTYKNPVVIQLENGKQVIYEEEELKELMEKAKEKDVKEKKENKEKVGE